MATNPCPCDSGKFAVDCCIQGNHADTKPANIQPPPPLTGFANPKCYARFTNDCSTKISGEHYISRTVLESMETADGVQVTGLRWQKQQVPQWISPGALTANILCKRHNEALSPLDAQAGRLIRAITTFDADFNSPAPKTDIKFFAGEDIERWMLKTTCGMVQAKALPPDAFRMTEVPQEWVDILFGKLVWNAPFGLYLKHAAEIRHSRSFFFQPRAHRPNGALLEAILHLNGLAFSLPVVRCVNPEALGIYRPRSINLRQAKVIKFVEFCWQDPQYEKGIIFERTGTYSGGSPGRAQFVADLKYPPPYFVTPSDP